MICCRLATVTGEARVFRLDYVAFLVTREGLEKCTPFIGHVLIVSM